MTFKSLERGKLYRVTWVDIFEGMSDHPDQAVPKVFRHTYRFYDRRYVAVDRKKAPYLIWTAGEPPDYYHAISIPEGCVSKVEPIENVTPVKEETSK